MSCMSVQVILPVVARKRGLDGHYEKADGSVPHKKPENEPIEPVCTVLTFSCHKRSRL
jgi:hypothetical protein